MARRSQINLIPFDQRNVFLLENVLSQEECNELIEQSETRGYKVVGPTGGKQKSWCGIDATKVRINSKVSFDSPETASLIYGRIMNFIPGDLHFRATDLQLTGDYLHPDTMGREWKRHSVCDHLRFVKYERGDQFLKHMDGTYQRYVVDKKDADFAYMEQSFLSIVVYLNDDFVGGETIFYDNITKKERFSVSPKAGSVLVMLHENLHEGTTVTKGVKYILRSDILFSKRISPSAVPEKDMSAAKKSFTTRGGQSVYHSEWNKVYHPSCKFYTD